MSDTLARGIIEFIGDSSQLEATFVRARELAGTTEQAVTQSAGKASQALSNIPKAAGPEFDKLDANAKRALTSLAKLTAQTELAPAAYRAWLLQTKGVSDQIAGPLVQSYQKALDKQEELRRSAQGAANSMGLVGISAGQASAAMRNLPAQFTDIFTSLASGQPAITVFLQQGGQIKDMFGGIGNAARAIAASISPAVLAIGAIGGAIAALATAYSKGSAETDAFRRSLVLTGNAAGATVAQLGATAETVARSVGTQGKAAEVLAALAATGKVAAGDLGKLTEAAIRLEREGGPAVEKTVEAFASLANDPTKAALKLNEATNFLTVATLEQIRALEKQGKEADAARVAQTAYADAAISRAKELERSLGTLEGAWRSVRDGAKSAWDEILAIGRPKDPVQGFASRVDQLRLRLEQGRRGAANFTDLFASDAAIQAELETTLKLQRLAERDKAAADEAARAAAEQAKLTKEYNESVIANKKWEEAALSTAKKIDAAIKKNRQDIETINRGRVKDGLAPITDAERLRQEQAIRDSFSKGGEKRDGVLEASRDAAKQWADAIADADKISRDATGTVDGLSRAQKRLIEYLTSPAYARNTDEQRTAAAAAFARADADERAAEANKALAKAVEENARAHARYLADLDKSIDASDKEVNSLKDQLAAMKGGKDAREEQIALRLEESAAQYEQIAASAAADGVDAAEYQRIQRISDGLREQVKIRRDIAKAASDKEVTQANEKAAKEAERAWRQTSDNIASLLETAIYGGWSSVWKRIQREAVLNFVVNPIANGLTGLIGGGSALGAAGSAGNLWGLVGGSSGVLGGYGGMGIISGNFAAGAQATMSGANLFTTLGQANQIGGLSGLAGGAGALMPYVAGVAAAYSIIRSLDSSGTPHVGGFVRVDERGLVTDNTAERGGIQNRETQTAVGQLAAGLLGALNSASGAFGGGSFAAQAAFESDSNDPSWAIFQLLRNGQQVGGFGATSGFASDPKAGFEEFASRASEVIIGALDDLDLPSWARDVLDALGDEVDASTLASAVQNITQTQKAIDKFGDSLEPLGGIFGRIGALSSDAVKSLSDMAGGLDGLSANLTTFFDRYYSDAEKAAMQTAAVSAALADVGLTMPATRAEFRALVEAQDLSTESGQRAFSTLIGVAGAFDQLSPAVVDMTESLQQAAAALAEERQRLTLELWELQGNTAAIREFERNQIDPANRDLFDEIQRLRDQQAAARTATSAWSDAGSTAVSAADRTRQAWEQAATSIADEIRRLRGIDEATPQGFAAAGASFAVATARARAGSAEAARSLPELARALDRSATQQASTATELALIRAQTAASLTETLRRTGNAGLVDVPLRVGGFDQVRALGIANGSDMNAVLVALLTEFRQSRTENAAHLLAIARFTAKTADLQDKWDATGLLTTS